MNENISKDDCTSCIKFDVCSLKNKYNDTIEDTVKKLEDICEMTSIKISCNHYKEDRPKLKTDLTFSYGGTD